MKRSIKVALDLALFTLAALSAGAQGTAFTYQGQLNDNNVPATGLYDLQFALYDSVSGGAQLGTTFTDLATPVTNGVFTVTLDFGNQFAGDSRWLELSVRTNGAASYGIMTPREPITPTPYAIFANTASNVSGTISAAQLPASVLTNGASGVNLSGTFSGDGSGLTGLNAVNLTGTVPAGSLGNAALLNGGNTFNNKQIFTGEVLLNDFIKMVGANGVFDFENQQTPNANWRLYANNNGAHLKYFPPHT